jgi:serine/threonine protein phosphatase 1
MAPGSPVASRHEAEILEQMLLFSRFFHRRSSPAAPRGKRVYAVGDIHGRLDLLETALKLIQTDNSSRRKARTHVIFLGDLIDRGPDSAGVIERLRTYHPPFVTPVFLLGNHEEVLLRVLDGDEALLGRWLEFGGAECLRSYGFDPEQVRHAPPSRALEMIEGAVPGDHVQFLRGFLDSVSFGGYLFVHAGIRPGVSVTEQVSSDLRWIRQPFLQDERDHGYVVVHGHTISEQVERFPNRIGIDTGAYKTGILTVLGVEGSDVWVLQTTS